MDKSDENQIELNLLADGFVSETISTAIRYLNFKAGNQGSDAGVYLQALAFLRIPDRSMSHPASPVHVPSAHEPKKVKFSSDEVHIISSREPRTPKPSSAISFVFGEDDETEVVDMIEVTRL